MGASTTALGVLAAFLGGALIVGGVILVYLSRNRPDLRPLAGLGLGRLSLITHAVVGLAAIGLGYHIVGHALALRAPMGPLWLAAVMAAVACLGSIGIDALERREDDAGPRGGDDGP